MNKVEINDLRSAIEYLKSIDGQVVKTTPWTGAVGILLHDTYETHPQQAILKKAYVNTTRAQKSSSLTYDLALITELSKSGCRIVLEEPEVLA